MVNGTERETVRQIKDAVQNGNLPFEFTPAQVNRVLKIHWAGVFLPKHRRDNLKGETEQFIRISSRPARYKLTTIKSIIQLIDAIETDLERWEPGVKPWFRGESGDQLLLSRNR